MSSCVGELDHNCIFLFLFRYLDFINVMTYDFHGNWDWFTGHHSPLYSRPQDTGSFVYLNTVSGGSHTVICQLIIRYIEIKLMTG